MSVSIDDGPRPILDERGCAELLRQSPRLDLARHLQAALRRGGHWTSLARDLWLVNRGPGRLTPHEYFYFRLYEDGLSRDEKRAFIGKRIQYAMHAACNEASWHAAATDKALFRAAMLGAGLPLPELILMYHPFRHALDGGRRISSSGALADFLRTDMPYPFFAKPTDGIYSLGAASISGHDGATDELLSADGSRIGVDAFAAGIARHAYGYQFQKRLSPHPAVADLIGERLATVRFVVLVTPTGPEIFRTVLKIPTGTNIADNFWRSGNLLAAVDAQNGEIKRVVRGIGEDQEQLSHHPDTGRPLIGARVPLWSDLTELCLAAASMLPGLRTQAWDIAVSAPGPVLIEVNPGGDVNLPQLAWGSGMLDDRFRAHLRACGYGGNF